MNKSDIKIAIKGSVYIVLPFTVEFIDYNSRLIKDGLSFKEFSE